MCKRVLPYKVGVLCEAEVACFIPETTLTEIQVQVNITKTQITSAYIL